MLIPLLSISLLGGALGLALALAARFFKVEGNPLAEDLAEIYRLLPPYLSLHGLLGNQGRVAGFRFGASYDDFLFAFINGLDDIGNGGQECFLAVIGSDDVDVVAARAQYVCKFSQFMALKVIYGRAEDIVDIVLAFFQGY